MPMEVNDMWFRAGLGTDGSSTWEGRRKLLTSLQWPAWLRTLTKFWKGHKMLMLPPQKTSPPNLPRFWDVRICWSPFLEYFKNYRSSYFLTRVVQHHRCWLIMHSSSACTPSVLLSILRQSCHWGKGKFRFDLGWDEGYCLPKNLSSAAVCFCGICLYLIF